MPLMAGSFEDFLMAVDEPPDEDLVKEALPVLSAARVTSQRRLVGLKSSDLEASESYTKDVAVRAFVRRAIGAAEAVEEARKAAAAGPPAPAALGGQASPAVQTMQNQTFSNKAVNLLGADASASALAAALQSKEVDVPALLKQATPNLGTWPFHLLPETALFQVLQAHTDAAKAASRTPFLYVDLTAKEVLPLWLAPDQVGGKHLVPGECDHLPELGRASSSSAVSALGQALKASMQGPRFFRSVHQWTAAFLQYLPAALACEHMNLQAAMSHQAMVTRLAEEARIAGKSPFIALVYDDLLRRSWAMRAERNDPDLDIAGESAKLNNMIFSAPEPRLSAVLAAARVSDTGVAAGREAGQPAFGDHQAAADAARMKAEAAGRDLAKKQNDLESREKALRRQEQSVADKARHQQAKGGGKGGQQQQPPQASRKEQKRGYWQDIRAQSKYQRR